MMVIKVISLLFVLLVACAPLEVEKRSAGSCEIEDRPYGKQGIAQVSCPELSFKVIYDNIPDGRDPLILRIEDAEAKKLSEKRVEPYEVKTGDEEVLSGWAYEEEWRANGHRLRGFEYFINGGSGCYEEEEGYKLSLFLEGTEVPILNFYQEDTDCGGN